AVRVRPRPVGNPAQQWPVTAKCAALERMVRLRQLTETIRCGEKDQATGPERGVRTQSCLTQTGGGVLEATRPCHTQHLLPDLQSGDRELGDLGQTCFSAHHKATSAYARLNLLYKNSRSTHARIFNALRPFCQLAAALLHLSIT